MSGLYFAKSMQRASFFENCDDVSGFGLVHLLSTILDSSDLRVPPEWLFDAGLGELFLVRPVLLTLKPHHRE